MQALAALGRRSEAVRHYQELAQRLKLELGTLPEAATVQLVDQLRSPGSLDAPMVLQSKRPSIAVLPFANLSNDPEQEYFADGVVEEIITALSRLHWLFVIARNSSFTYKGRAVDVRQVGRELGVRYILEGSLRKSGSRVRIAGQLIDAESGTTIWADRFEGELRDLFDLQDQITSHTVAAIAPRLEEAEIARSKHKPTDSLDAYDYYLRGLAGLNSWSRHGNEDALHYFKRAIALDPKFAAAYGLAARCISQRKAMNWMEDQTAEETEAIYLSERAAEFGREDAIALATAGFTLVWVAGRFADADALTERALQLNPNYAWGWFFSGFVKAVSGEPEIAIERLSRALMLSPQDPLSYSMEISIATAHFVAGRYPEALAQTQKASRMQPHRFSTLSLIAVCSAYLGQQENAKTAAERLRELEPNLRLSNLHRRCYPMKRSEDFDRLKEGLRLAGFPE
jgi:TolB-like protein/Tfp pilus assembly protein PilF